MEEDTVRQEKRKEIITSKETGFPGGGK